MSQYESISVRTIFSKGYPHEAGVIRANSEESTLLCSADKMSGKETYTVKPVTLYERSFTVSFDSVEQMKCRYPRLSKYAEVYTNKDLADLLETPESIKAVFSFQVDQEQAEFLSLVNCVNEMQNHKRSARQHKLQAVERAKLECIIREKEQTIDNYESMWSVKLSLFLRNLFN